MVLFIVVASAIILLAAYFTYGKFLANTVFKLDDKNPVPSVEMEDGVDYVPAKKGMLLGQHFSAIAAAGPINGPILAAVIYGWAPALLWVILGCIFIGGIHDMGSLVASVRHKAKSITEVVRLNVSQRAWILFMIFVWITLVYVIVAFTDITASSFVGNVTLENGEVVSGAGIASSSAMYLALPIIMGLLMRFGGLKEGLAVAIFLPLVGVAIWAGQSLPLSLPVADPATAQKIWGVLILVYCLVAAMMPMWLLLQPRGALGGYFLYIALVVAAIGIMFGGYEINYPAFTNLNPDGSLGEHFWTPMFPILFITIACGAVSGFHSLVSSGTSSKTVSNEKDMLFIGYGSMLIESILAVVSLIVVGAAATGGVMPKGTPFQIFAGAVGGFMGMFGLSAHVATCVITMCVSALALTTLDSVGRIGRMCFQELFTSGKPEEMSGLQKVLTNKYFATIITLFFGYLLCLGGYMNVWPLFGAANQLCAALVFISLSVFLKVTGRQGWMLYVPMGFMFAATMSALAMSIYGIVNKLVTGAPFGMLTDGLQLVVAIALIILALLIATNGLKTLCGSKAGSKNETANA